VINDADGTQLRSYQTNRRPELSSGNLEISGYLLKIDIGSGFMLKTGQDYSL